MAPDQEELASAALDSMEGLLDLLDGRAPGMTIDPEGIAALLRLIHAATKQAIPSGMPLHKRAANDMGDDD